MQSRRLIEERGREARGPGRATCCPPPSPDPDLRPLDGPAAIADLAAYGKALGQATRVKIVRLLLQQEGCALTDLVKQLGLAPSTLSDHLSVLREAGLIRDHSESDGGRKACYCIDPRAMRRLRALVVSL
jgi:ArsR family transcriptional regulator